MLIKKMNKINKNTEVHFSTNFGPQWIHDLKIGLTELPFAMQRRSLGRYIFNELWPILPFISNKCQHVALIPGYIYTKCRPCTLYTCGTHPVQLFFITQQHIYTIELKFSQTFFMNVVIIKSQS